MDNIVSILGGGSWGTALAKVLCENNSKVKIWVRNRKQVEEIKETRINSKYLPNIKIQEKIIISSDVEEVLYGSNTILLAVPSQKVREVLNRVKGQIHENTLIINAVKGIEKDTLNTMSEIVKQETISKNYVMLSGPSHAEEVALKMPTVIVAASEHEKLAKHVQEIFMLPYFRVYTNDDVRGVELGGALKNVIALGAGISDGIGYGDNAKAALMNRGIIEISRLGENLGAQRNTFFGLTGIGDLIVTCTSKHSRNRKAGYLIGQGYNKNEAVKEVGMVVEGITTTYAAYELARKNTVLMPIVEELYGILEKKNNVKESVINLMLRKKKGELEFK